MSLVVVGSVALDTVETASATRERILGGAACFVSLAAAHFTGVKLVGIIGEDFPSEHIALLTGRQIDCTGLERAAGKTFFWHGRYAPDFSTRTSLATELGVFADFHPELPPDYREAETLFLANIHPALQSHVCRQMTHPRLIAADTMDFWIQGEPAALAETLRLVDLLTINDEEVRLLAGEHNIVKAARAVLRMGPRALVVKRGEHGALLFTGEETADVFALPALPLTEVVDPTGAGDTFAGGMMGYLDGVGRLDAAALRRGVAYGTAAASFTVADFSLDGLQRATRSLLDERVEALSALTAF